MLAAQHAPIGAKICTSRAIRTMGRKFFSRLRITDPSERELITPGVRSRDQVPGFFFAPRWNFPGPAGVRRPTRPGAVTKYPVFGVFPAICNRQWRNLNHFAECWNFEQSLLKMVTRRTRWSNSAGSGWPKGSSLVVQVSGGALTRTSSVASTIKNKSKFSRKIRVDTVFEQGSKPCSFF